MAYYRKKPVVIEAVHWVGTPTWADVGMEASALHSASGSRTHAIAVSRTAARDSPTTTCKGSLRE